MQELLEPITTESLKDVFVTRFESLILSGKLKIGQKLPSERELAVQLGVSRPVVHEGLVDLSSKGLITLKPRSGATVNDFRREGSPSILMSLFNYHEGKLDTKILNSVLSLRILFEVETAKLAAIHRTKIQLEEFEEILRKEETISHHDVEGLAELDFNFHHLITIASDNLIYPLLLNSMKLIYTNLSSQFYSDPLVIPKTFSYHEEMVEAIKEKNTSTAASVMQRILKHGEKHFILMINGRK